MTSFLGRIKTVKDLFLDKLDVLLARTEAIETATDATLRSTTASLDADTYLVESMSRQVLAQEMFFKKVASLQQYQVDVLQRNEGQLQDLASQARQAGTHLQAAEALVRRSSTPQPALALMNHLYSYLPSRLALDASAHTGEATAALLEAGFVVYAFEPRADCFEKLALALQDRPDCHLFNYAYTPASASGEANSPNRTNQVPTDIALARLGNTEENLRTIGGSGEPPYPVVVSEFCAAKAGAMHLGDQVALLRRRGYYWHLVLYTEGPGGRWAFYCNRSDGVEAARGDVFFFSSHALFSEAYTWCRAVLPTTYFC